MASLIPPHRSRGSRDHGMLTFPNKDSTENTYKKGDAGKNYVSPAEDRGGIVEEQKGSFDDRRCEAGREIRYRDKDAPRARTIYRSFCSSTFGRWEVTDGDGPPLRRTVLFQEAK